MGSTRGMMVTACLAVVLVALAGCQSVTPASVTTPRAAVTNVNRSFEIVTKTGSFPAERQIVSLAEEKIISRCMARKGLSYRPRRVGKPESSSDADGALAESRIRRNGYGLFGKIEGDDPTGQSGGSAGGDVPGVDSSLYDVTLLGTEGARRSIRLPSGIEITFPGDGCIAEARGELFKDVMTGARVVHVPQDIERTLAARVRSDSSFKVAMGRWSRCMTRRGYEYSSPEAAREDLQRQYARAGATRVLRQREIEVAVADVECARRNQIPRLISDLERKYFDALPTSVRTALEVVAEEWSSAVATSRRVIGQHG
ncbi:hypothetical protein [Actinopolymorpha alba]|uniref:hypothetical protein n=1 Tax=Actinopolymorpha alba TaxID=533267 RepID=UPI0012F6CA90|nr:hypothetical protein [Actinopolymorpha alba]